MSPRPLVFLTACVLASFVPAAECPAIEMWTFYGDGSRIGLPSLEVPVEAYPGIPLRSDRIRMRRRAVRQGAPGAGSRTGAARTITLRAPPAADQDLPVAPEPEDLVPPAAR